MPMHAEHHIVTANLSICLSHAAIVSKRMHIELFPHYLVVFRAPYPSQNFKGTPSAGTLYMGEGGEVSK